MEGGAPTHNKYGFSIEDQEQHEKQEEYYNGRYSSEVEKQQARWAEWLSDNVVGVKLEGGATRPFVPHEAKENAELLDMARKGIPTEQRGMVWLGVSGGRDRLDKSLAGEGQLRYAEILATPLEPGEDRERFERSQHEIEKDLKRTFPKHERLSGEEYQGKLRQLLCAYARRNPRVGAPPCPRPTPRPPPRLPVGRSCPAAHTPAWGAQGTCSR